MKEEAEFKGDEEMKVGNVFLRNTEGKTILCAVLPELNLKGESMYDAVFCRGSLILLKGSGRILKEARGNDITGLLCSCIWRTGTV